MEINNATNSQNGSDESIRSFRFAFPQAELDDLRGRILSTRWSEKETVDDFSQGTPLATLQAIAKYWATSYDWRKAEAQINNLPQFVTNVDGIDIHFVHVRSQNPNALPILITPGWPASITHYLKVIGPLTDPEAFGGTAETSLRRVIIPSTARVWIFWEANKNRLGAGTRSEQPGLVLMKRLGYNKFVAQGGDWGALITELMASTGSTGTDWDSYEYAGSGTI
jgi:hypothetical protein